MLSAGAFSTLSTSYLESNAEVAKLKSFSCQFGSVSNSYKGSCFKGSVAFNRFSCNGEAADSGLVVDSDGKLIKKFIAVLIPGSVPFHLEAFPIAFCL